MTMDDRDDRGDDPAARTTLSAVPAALAAVPAGSMVRVSVQTGGRRVLLGIGTFGSIEPGVLETGADDLTPIGVREAVASPAPPIGL
jgi:hypothetical protein